MSDKKTEIPVESRDYSLLYIVFSGVLFLGTVWAVWDEVKVRRPWKVYQEEYRQLLVQRLDSLHGNAVDEIDTETVSALQEQLAKAQAAMESEEFQQAVEAKEQFLRELGVATREWRFARSRSDAAYYLYQKSKLEGNEDSKLRQEVASHDADIAKYAKEMEGLNANIEELDRTINTYRDEAERLQAELTNLYADANAYEMKLQHARLMPVAVQQVMLNDFEFTPFQEIKARIDRCQTCHSGWTETLMEDAPQ
ncbi:MAG: hypothetical protein ACRDGA_13810, partial [Bacteroidota bacterium]